MRPRKPWSVTGLALALVAGWGVRAPAATDCPRARSLADAGYYELAEQAARDCLGYDPFDPTPWPIITRSLVGLERLGAARFWVDVALDRHPYDVSLRVWRARLLAWEGKRRAALADLDALPPAFAAYPDVVRLRADINYWSKDYQAAVGLYGVYLDAQPDDAYAVYSRGVALQKVGRVEAAREDFARACRLQPDATRACDALRPPANEDDARPIYALVLPGWRAAVDREVEWTLGLAVGGLLLRHTEVEAGVQLAYRDYGPDRQSDTVGHLSVTQYLDDEITLTVGGAGAVDPAFSPTWSAYVEPGITLGAVALKLRYWRISFVDDGAHVVMPQASLRVGSVALDALYALAIEDDDGPNHAGLGRVGWVFPAGSRVHVGVGGGNSADYIESRQSGSERYVLGLVGGRYQVTEAQWLAADYTLRQERLGDVERRQHQVLGGYGVTF